MSGEDDKETTLEGIRKLILKSGYPLEIDVADYLRKDKWIVFSQYPYIDRSENNIRLIDILAMKGVFKELGVSLLIECKKSVKHGWAFHTLPKRGELQSALAAISDVATKLQGRIDLMKAISDQEEFQKFHPMNSDIKVGTVCFIPPKHKDDFHEASYQLMNAMKWLRNSMLTQLTFPIIVYDGPMWEFYKEEGTLKVIETNHLQYLSVLLYEDEQAPCLIDVVKSSYFSEFLKLVNGSIEWIKSAPKY